jgi:type II secretory pathway pseudopilin PulG
MRRVGICRSQGGFTLLEIVIVLTLLIIIAALSVPTMRGLKDEEAARAPISELADMVKETRLQAMKDQRPYQIAFTSMGFSATRYFSPYMQAAQLEEFTQKIEIDEEQRAEIAPSIATSDPVDPSKTAATPSTNAPGQQSSDVPFKEWTRKYKLPDNLRYSVQLWYEIDPTPIEGDVVKLWVFQPSGIVIPMTLSLDRDNAHFDISFNALTGDIAKESSQLK